MHLHQYTRARATEAPCDLNVKLQIQDLLRRDYTDRRADFDRFRRSYVPALRCRSHITIAITMAFCFPSKKKKEKKIRQPILALGMHGNSVIGSEQTEDVG